MIKLTLKFGISDMIYFIKDASSWGVFRVGRISILDDGSIIYYDTRGINACSQDDAMSKEEFLAYIEHLKLE